ncbi:MAG: DUF434 domain-containing protein [Deltaproteobacteria bacterium]|nr:MAG: DUF434 domain-containing protein [Deltaproteobacteria bacterium]
MEIKGELWRAAEDLRYLLNRGYPREGSLQLVGNRYNLTQDLRDLLRRGVFSDQIAEARRKKMVSAEQIRGKGLAIDGYNVLITLESALKGKTILLADDSFIRDISGVSGSYKESAPTGEALNLIIDLLQTAEPLEAIFLFDSPISGSGELAAKIRGLMTNKGIRGDALAVKVPERIMEGYAGIVASSDTALIDQVQKVFDMAGYIIREKLRIPYIELSKE